MGIVFGSGPKGNSLARAKNDHSGNKIRTTFYNYGLVGRWTSEPEDIGGEWPINSGHEYIGDVGHMVGTEFVDLNNIKKKSKKNKIDTRITLKVWKSMINAFIQYEFRNFKKKK